MIIITGAAGFIGSNILKALNAKGISDILIVDHLTSKLKQDNLNNTQYTTYIDKAEFLNMLPTLENVTAIIHQGACSSTTETDIDYLQKNNIDYSKTLLHYSIEKNIPFLYASSAAVYGDGKLGFDDASNDYYPINAYGNSKLVFDKYVAEIFETQKPKNKIIGFRYFNVYGHGEAHKNEMSSVVYKFYQSYLQNKEIKLFEGSDKILRDFIHIDDIVKVNLFCLENEIENNIYNVGTGKASSFLALAQAFQKAFPDSQLITMPFPEILKEK
jgi:ADP-L-glycero-D-manno-heptose 6-epimerase